MALTSLNTFMLFLRTISINVSVGGSVGPVLKLEKECEDGGTETAL